MINEENIANYSKNKNVRVYFFSTANVFDGDPSELKYEDNRVNAESEYGRFKINCENMLIEELGVNAIIIRLSMIFGKDSLQLINLDLY